MTNPDKIKNVLTDVGKVCENCKYDGEPYGCNRPDGLCEMFNAVWDALDYIQELEKRVADLEAKVPKWVSVKDALPEHVQGNYLILLGGEIYAAKWEYDEWNEKYAFRIDCQIVPNITHWAKAPELPKEENYDEPS